MSVPSCVQQVRDTMAETDWYRSYQTFTSQQRQHDKDIADIYEVYERLRRKDIEHRRTESQGLRPVEAAPPTGSVEDLQQIISRQETSIRQKSKQIESQQALLGDLQSQLSAQENQIRDLSSRLATSMAQAGQLMAQLESTQKILEKREIELVNLRSDLVAIENHHSAAENSVITRDNPKSEPIVSPAALLVERIPKKFRMSKRFDDERPPQFITTGNDGAALTSTGDVLYVLSISEDGIGCEDIVVPAGAADVVCGSFSANNNMVIAGTSEGGLVLINRSLSDGVKSLKGHTGKIKNCWFVDSNKAISAAADRTIKFWDINRLCPVGSIPVVSQIVNASLCKEVPSILVSSHQSGDITLWSGTQKVHQFSAHSDACLGASMSNDGKYIISAGSDDTVKVFDVKMIQAGPVHSLTGGFTSLSTEGPPGISWDSTVFSVCIGGGIRFWEMSTGKHLTDLSTDALLHAWYPRMVTKVADSEAHILTVHSDRQIKWHIQSRLG